MMSLTFGLFNQVSGLGPLGPLVSVLPPFSVDTAIKERICFCRSKVFLLRISPFRTSLNSDS